MTCKAIQQSDEMFCAKCDLRWDVNDFDPPACKTSYRKIVGLCGAAGSGKSTLATYLVEDLGYTRLKFAGPLKAMTAALLRELQLPVRTCIEGEAKDQPVIMDRFTPRHIMQTLGTEWGRDTLSSDFWVSILREQVRLTAGNIVIDDVRFENEAQMVRSLGGNVIRIKGRGGISGMHISEAGSGINADHVIDNSRSVEDMCDQFLLI